MPEVAEQEVAARAPVHQAQPFQLDASLQQALDRLLLANQIRELTSYPKPVTLADVERLPRGAKRLVNRIDGAGQGTDPHPRTRSLLRGVLGDALILLWLRLLLCRGNIWRLGRETAGTMARNGLSYGLRYWARPMSRITGFVRSTEKEEPLIRTCLSLRVMKRYAACVGFLIDRLRSGLPADQTRQWLAFFLREMGDLEAARRLDPAPDGPGRLESLERCSRGAHGPVMASAGSSRLTYGLVMPVMFDSEVFRSSLVSLLESDFQGQIVVVEDGYQSQRVCEAFCQRLPVTYVKNPTWTGCSAGTNLGIEQLDADTRLVIYAQNDILWPQRWFDQFNDAWELVYDTGKVEMLNLGYVQFNPGLDPAFRELFLRGQYEQLLWVFRMMRELQPSSRAVLDLQNRDPERLFGLGRDAWEDRPAELRMMTGKFSVAGSFPLGAWRDLGGFSPEMPFGLDIELQYHSCLNRKWNLWLSTPPLIHLSNSDTRCLRGEDKARFSDKSLQTYDGFVKKYGVEVDHFLWTWYAETRVIDQDEIVEAANRLCFEDIEFVFDDLFARLRTKRLSTCELTDCRSRAVCRYV